MVDVEDSQGTSSQTVHKGYKILRDKMFGTFYVVKVGKGPIPNILSGSFQSWKMVVDLIDRFVDSK